MLSALAVWSLELGLPSGRSGHLESPDCKKGWVCAVAAPQPLQPAALTEFWQQFPAQCRTCPSGGEAAADVSVGPQHQPQPRRGPAGLWAGVLCFVFWPDPGEYQCGIYSWGRMGIFCASASPHPAAVGVVEAFLQVPCGGLALQLDEIALGCLQAVPLITGVLGPGGPH